MRIASYRGPQPEARGPHPISVSIFSEKAEVPVTQDLVDVQVFCLASGVKNPANTMTERQRRLLKRAGNHAQKAGLTVLVLSPCSSSGSPPGTTGRCQARRAALWDMLIAQ